MADPRAFATHCPPGPSLSHTNKAGVQSTRLIEALPSARRLGGAPQMTKVKSITLENLRDSNEYLDAPTNNPRLPLSVWLCFYTQDTV